MSTEPEALRLARTLDLSVATYPPHYTDVDAAASELRRLHAENATLTDSNIAKADRIDRLGEMVERLTAQRAEDEKLLREVANELSNLHALVWGECPSLLNEDSGGDSAQDMAIRDALSNIRKRLGENSNA